jgi:glutamate synthase domain-containing protein 2
MKTRWTRLLPAVPLAAIVGVAAYDLTQKKHALLRNFPVIGHLRYLLESIGPELRQYIISGNDEERPFSRNQRRWVYASSKMQNNYFGFGSDSDMEYRQGYPVVKHRTFAKIAPHAGVHSDAWQEPSQSNQHDIDELMAQANRDSPDLVPGGDPS